VYVICDNEHITVAEYARVGWQLGFRRMMSSEDFDEWSELQRVLGEVAITNDPDKISWGGYLQIRSSPQTLYINS
jgi:hypothetical protein